MVRRLTAVAFALLLHPTLVLAQLPAPPTPLFPGAAPRSVEPEPLPPVDAGPARSSARVFCEQPITVRLVEVEAVTERYRPFVGIWSDASWTPQLCAALIVQSVTPDGNATIVYAFGPMNSPKGAGARAPGGVLHGTGVIRDGELRFQNSDGSQFAFRPVYADLAGRLTAPQGQTYEAIFKKTP